MSSRLLLPGLTAALLSSVSAHAADLPMRAAPPPVVEEHCKTAITTPTFGPTIKQNPNPACWVSPIGDLYFGGALSGYAYHFDDPFSPVSPVAAVPLNTERDRANRLDFTNVIGYIQKADGPFQFFVAAGGYSVPALGLPVYSTIDQNQLLFGPVPVAYGKYVIDDNWSIQGGRMFTNIGTELLFTFQNMNISRGLVFNQENLINQGAQVNYTNGPWNASLSVNDGFYSGSLNWVTGLLTYKIDDNNLVGVNGGTHFSKFDSRDNGSQFQFATPVTLQNSSIVSVNYTYTNGPLTLSPYAQYTVVDADSRLGIVGGAETYGGAFLAAYGFTDNFFLAGRVEYIAQSGNRNNPTTTSLLYGPGSSAFSVTVTPTFLYGQYFLRAEYSHTHLYDIQVGNIAAGTLGTGFGVTGNGRNQDRYMIETGVTF